MGDGRNALWITSVEEVQVNWMHVQELIVVHEATPLHVFFCSYAV